MHAVQIRTGRASLSLINGDNYQPASRYSASRFIAPKFISDTAFSKFKKEYNKIEIKRRAFIWWA